MAVHIDEMTSEVTAESEAPREEYGNTPWEEQAQLRDLYARLMRDRLRTAAGGFDD